MMPLSICLSFRVVLFGDLNNVYYISDNIFYYIPMNDTTLELSVFWPSDTESRINELRFSECISLSFKTRLTSVTCFSATLRKVNFKHGTKDGKHDDITSYYMA